MFYLDLNTELSFTTILIFRHNAISVLKSIILDLGTNNKTKKCLNTSKND